MRLEKDGEQDYIVRSHGNYMMDRSVSVDIDLEPGTYSVLMKVTAKRDTSKSTPEQVIRESCRDRQEKLLQIGLAYDLAHAKGQIKETEDEKKIRLEHEAKKKATDHQKRRAVLRARWLKDWETGKKHYARIKRHAKRKEEHDKKVEARKAAVAKATVQKEDVKSADAGASKTKITDQAENVDSPGTTETVKQDTPATTDEPSTEAKSDITKPEETKPTAIDSGASESAGAKGTNDSPTKVQEGVPEQQDAATTRDEGNRDDTTTDQQSDKDTAAEDKAAQFEAALKNVPSAVDDGTAAAGAAPGTMPVASTVPAPLAAAGDDDWEHDSLASFASSIVTDLDYSELYPTEGAAPPIEPPGNMYPDEEDELTEFRNDPWNAVCVVGLKVYSKDEGLSVAIVRPKSEGDEETPLDLDDNSKGASGETTKNAKEPEEVSTGIESQDKIETEVKEGGEA